MGLATHGHKGFTMKGMEERIQMIEREKKRSSQA